jgi:hypothetical protein
MIRKRVFPVLLALAVHASARAAVTVSISNQDVMRGATVDVPIRVQGLLAADSLIAYQAVLAFNATIVQAVGASRNGTMTQNWGDPTVGIKGDTVRVAGITTNQPSKRWVADDGKLFNLNFFVVGDVGSVTTVRIHEIKLFNKSGAITVTSKTDGQLTVVTNPATKTMNIDLNPNWNQISFSLTPNAPDTLPGVLGGVPVVYIKSWVSTGKTKSWDAVRPWFLNDLKKMDGIHGYLLKLNSPSVQTLSLTGAPVLVITPFLMYQGWSLISYLPESRDSLSHAFATLGKAYRYVSSFVQSWDRTRPDFLNSLKITQPGVGYLVKMDTAKVLIYPSSGYKVLKLPARPVANAGPQRVHSSSKGCDFWAWQSDLFVPGDTVRVYDEDGVVCGDTLIAAQKAFMVHVAGDDPTTPDEDEGANEGDTLRFEIGGKKMFVVGTSPSFDTTIVVGQPALWEDMGSKHVRLGEYTSPVQGGRDPGMFHGFRLEQNHPNPFNSRTVIRFFIPDAKSATLTIFDVNGRMIRKWVRERAYTGNGEVVWDGRDTNGMEVPSGTYMVRLEAGKNSSTRKCQYIK